MMILDNKSTGWGNIFFFLIFSCFFTTLMLVGLTAAAAVQKPVAKVNNTVLTEADLEAALNEIMPAGVFHGGFSSKKRTSYRPKAFEKMIEKELFYQEAVKKGLKIEEELIEKEREKTVKRLGGEKKFKAALKRAGLTDKHYREKLRKKQLVKRFVNFEVKNKAEASEEEVNTYYQKNREKFMRPEARRIRHILIKVPPSALAPERALKKQRALEALDKLKTGEDMSQVAWNYSDGQFRVKGGDFGLVHKGRLDPDLEKEVFKLEPGRISDILKTRYGYHIVRVEEVRAPEQLSLEDVFLKIQKELTAKKEKQIRKVLITRLKSEARIEILNFSEGDVMPLMRPAH